MWKGSIFRLARVRSSYRGRTMLTPCSSWVFLYVQTSFYRTVRLFATRAHKHTHQRSGYDTRMETLVSFHQFDALSCATDRYVPIAMLALRTHPNYCPRRSSLMCHKR